MFAASEYATFRYKVLQKKLAAKDVFVLKISSRETNGGMLHNCKN